MAAASQDESAAVVLEEAIDQNYEPSQQEIREYAEWVGIDPERDPDLLWIAKAGLKAPLPAPWKPCQAGEDGEIFYFNFETGESVWDHPCDEYHRQLYAKEYSKKYGHPPPNIDEPNKSQSDSEVDATPRNASRDDESKKDKKDKKEKKKDKKEKKEKKNTKELAPLSVPPAKNLGASALGVALGIGLPISKRERDMDLESSLEESLDPDEGSSRASEKLAPADDPPSPRDQSLPTTSELKSLEEVLGGSLGSGGTLLPVAEEPSEEPPVAAERLSEDRMEAKLKKDREAVRKRLERELEEWTSKEEAKQEEEQSKKKAAIEAENKSKLEKHRKDMKEQLESEKEKIFTDLQAEHDRDVNEEKRKLKKAFAEKKGILQNEVEKDVEALAWKDAQNKALEERISTLEAELGQAKVRNAKLEEELETARSEAAATAAEAASTTEKLQSWEVEIQKLKSVAATGDEALKKELLGAQSERDKLTQELADAKHETELKQQECERLRTDNAANASAADEIKRLQAKLAEAEAKPALGALELEELQDLRSQLEVVSSEFAKSVEKATRLEDENARLEKEAVENYAMAAKAQEAQDQLKAKEAKLASASVELTATKEKLAASNEATASAKMERDAARKELEKLRSDLQSTVSLQEQTQAASTCQMQQDLQTLRSQLEQAKSDLLKAREEASMRTSSYDQEISRIKTELDAKRTECDGLRDAASENSRSTTDSLELVQKECQRLRDMAAESSKSASESMQGLQKRYDEECRRAAQAKVDATQELAMLRAELNTKAAECERLHARVAEASNRSIDDVQKLQSQLTEERSQSVQAKAETAAITRELAALRVEVESRTKECESLKTKDMISSRTAQEDIRQMQTQSAAQLRETQDELQRVQSQLATQVREMTILRIEFDAKETECKRVQERIAESSSIAAEEIRRLKAQLDEERRCSAQSVAEATSTACELSSLRAELEAKSGVAEELRRLQKELDEHQRVAAGLRAEAASASCELATLRAELDARSSECGRLRAEVSNGTGMASEEVRRLRSQLDEELEAFAKLKVEASASARELLAARTELETLQHQASRPSALATSEEERSLRCLLREREDDIFRLKADNAEAAAVHAREMENLRARLAELRGRQNDSQATAIGDMQVQLRERAGEIEKLHADLRSSASEIERLKCEARSLEVRAAASETAAAESAKALAADQWRREIKRMEELVRQRDAEIVAANDQAERAQREIRRLEVEEHRSAQRIEEVRIELERSRQELHQFREDNAEIERRLEDARAALRSDHAARSLAEGQAREAQREVRDLRAQFQHQALEVESLANEAKKERQALANNEAEITRLQQQILSKDAEIRQLRSTTEVMSQQGELVLRRRVAELSTREHALGDRERLLSEREASVAEAETAWSDRRRELRDDLPRSESAGLRLAISELAAPAAASRRTLDSAAMLSNSSPRRRAKLEDVDSVPIDTVGVDQVDDPLRIPAGASSDEGELEKLANPIVEQEGGAGHLGMHLVSPLGSPREASAIGDAIAALDSRRRELRRERASLDELRKMWKSDLQRVQSSGGNAEAQTVLGDIKAVLDERTVSLNNMIEEYKVLERAISVQRAPRWQRKYISDSNGTDAATAKATPKLQADTGGALTPKAGTQDYGFLARWQHLLSPSTSAGFSRPRSARSMMAVTPRNTIGERNFANYRQKAKASRIVVDQHLSWLRGFQREVSSGRPLSARGSPHYGMA